MEIISEVQKHQNARVFAFGIGSSVNRFLLDKIADAGRGEVEYVGLNDDGSAAARRFHERVRNPLLTDISIDWNGLAVADVYPQRIPDLFSAKPVVVTGRFTSPGRATIRLKGKMAGQDYVREIPVELPETMASHDVLASLWARARVDNLMDQDYQGAQSGNMRADLKDTITQLGIEYRLMTQFTSFVAVEERVVTDGGQPRRIDVPVEVPEGVNRETAYGEMRPSGTLQAPTTGSLSYMISSGSLGGSGGGGGGGKDANVRRRVSNVRPMATPVPPAKVPSTIGLSTADAPPPAPIEPPDEVRQKVHHAVFAVVERLRKKEALTAADEGGFIRNGKAEVQVWLSEKSVAALAQLKALGFEVVLDDKNSKLIIGRVSIDKLEMLVKLKFVNYVSPQK